MKTISILLITIVFVFGEATSQVSLFTAESNMMCLSVESQYNNNVNAFIGNQAILSKSAKPFAGIYSENRFMAENLNSVLLFGGLSFENINVSALINCTGTTFYKEQTFSLGFSKKLNSKCNIGIRFNYLSAAAFGYKKLHFINADGGIVIKPTAQISVGINVSNLLSIKLNENESIADNAVFRFKWGIGYDISKQFFWGVDFSKTRGSALNIQSLMQYKLSSNSFVKYGFSLSNYCSSLSFSFLVKKINITVSSSFNLKLGLSSGMMLTGKTTFEK